MSDAKQEREASKEGHHYEGLGEWLGGTGGAMYVLRIVVVLGLTFCRFGF